MFAFLFIEKKDKVKEGGFGERTRNGESREEGHFLIINI
jgi:hypothetical protein